MSHIDLTPPESVAKAAAKGLKLRQEFNRGGTQIGVARAQTIARPIGREHDAPAYR